MKQELVIQGRVELAPTEVAEAAVNFLANTEKKLTQAIEAWLDSKHNLKTARVRYSKVNSGIQAVVDVKSAVKDAGVTHFSDDDKEKRNAAYGFARPNVGIGDTMRELIADERKKAEKNGKKTASIKFSTFFKDVKDFHPEITDDRLALYLHDKRVVGEKVDLKKRQDIITIGV